MYFLFKLVMPFGVQIGWAIICKPFVLSYVTIIKTANILGIQIGKMAIEIFVFNGKAIGWKNSDRVASDVGSYLP
jgi:hypothetical protein